MADTAKRLKAFLKSPKGSKAAVALLIVAAALIALSEFFPRAKKTETVSSPSVEEEEHRLEKRLEEILERMAGVGECDVMVTFSQNAETAYATERKTSQQNEKKTDGSLSGSSQTEETYILIEDDAGNQTALEKTTVAPPIRGVVVVCTGGASATVRARVSDAVKTALGIGADRIFVTDAH